MELTELHRIVSQWYSTGLLSAEDRQAVKIEYARLVGEPGERCQTCASFWNDVLITLRIHLKQNQLPVMSKSRKWMIREDSGHLQVVGEQTIYINTGVEQGVVKLLTDEKAEAILKKYPEYKDIIVRNPDYEEPKKPANGASTAKSPAASNRAKTTAKPATSTAPKPATSKNAAEPADQANADTKEATGSVGDGGEQTATTANSATE
ncbi:hypothetical protein DYU11_22570 [Fibrisoma montanum]|uniref:Uncharacterized protein n=1 Tax=Fibrisoma montanum TaxID=2305895 RepID=A0A418M224_9BACT|nr:hypothetical protein [Fibrisoma montanum]RIV19716.1 hypothetical protein DYU11_22570 [Fibrisoma montanum]